MNRIDRLYALVEELRAAGPRGRTAGQLAARFEVSVRTVERDLSALGHAGVPLATKQGRTGGYTLDRSMSLPPLNFTPREARTGLTPAGDDELATEDHLHKETSHLLGARKIEVNATNPLPQPRTPQGDGLNPLGKGIEAIVFHTIVDQRGCGEFLPFMPLVGLRQQARDRPPEPRCRDGMSVSAVVSVRLVPQAAGPGGRCRHHPPSPGHGRMRRRPVMAGDARRLGGQRQVRIVRTV
jgi:HTH domain